MMGSIKAVETKTDPQNLAVLEEFSDLEEAEEEDTGTAMAMAQKGMEINPVIKSTFDYDDDDAYSDYSPNQGFKRYYPSLRAFFPAKVKANERDVLPIDRVGLCSFMTQFWMSANLWAIFRKGAAAVINYRIPILDSCRFTTQRLSYLWQEEINSKGLEKAVFGNATAKFVRTRFALATALFSINLALGFITPVLLLSKLIEYLDTPDAPLLDGILLVVYILVVDGARAFMMSFCWNLNIVTGFRLRSAILGLLFNKMVHLRGLGEKSVGELINIFANDGTRMLEYVLWGRLWIAGTLTIVTCLAYIIWALGLPALIALGVFILFFIIQFKMSKGIAYFRLKAIRAADRRVRQTTEVLNYIKMIKLYAWEKSFFEKITALRNEERKYLEIMSIIQNVGYPLSFSVPIIATIATYLTCFALDYDLSPAVAFPVCGALILCRTSLIFLPMSAAKIAEFKTTLIRAESILKMEEFTPISTVPNDPNLALQISNAAFAWDAVQIASPNVPKKKGKESKRRRSKLKRKDQTNGNLNNPAGEGEEEKLKLTGDVNRNGLTPVLLDINLAIPQKQLIGICGKVGSGKSSLINTILGQLNTLRGDVSVRGLCAYVSQQAWIMNATVLENITFGECFDEKKFQEAILCCGLVEDIENLPGGLDTEIGERGVNMSGGQKQRISLARAVYSDRDIYLLDDPLSAVDYRVGAHIFQHCIKGALKTKTVLFVSHLTHYLDQCDYVIVVDDGRIVEEGEPKKLKLQNGLYTDLATTLETMQEEAEQKTKPSDDIPAEASGLVKVSTKTPGFDENEKNAGKRITTDEKMERGVIGLGTYVHYIRAAGGFMVASLIIFAVGLNIAIIGFSNWWLTSMIDEYSSRYLPVYGNFTNDLNLTNGNVTNDLSLTNNNLANDPNLTNSNFANDPNFTINYYTNVTEDSQSEKSGYHAIDDVDLLVYGCCLAAIFLSIILRAYTYVKGTLRASSQLHKQLLVKVIESPMVFFETVPIGRIINLFSKDQDEVDTQLSISMEGFLNLFWMILVSLLMIVLVFPWFLVLIAVFAVIFMILAMVFQTSLRELKRFENVSRSPLFGHISAMIQGLSTIHSFQKENDFSRKFCKFQDENTAIQMQLQFSTRWVGFRLDLVVVTLVVVTALFAVFWKGVVPAAYAGLALTYCAQMAGMFNFAVRNMAETQARFTNVERIVHHIKSLVQEGSDKVATVIPSKDWPSKGEVVFENVSMRYRHGLPLALKNISFRVGAGERIGIVGRTGSGKSSLAVALFRLVELAEGRIIIDDYDVSQIRLLDLRQKLSLIPQDPVLFLGTIRYNLDTFEQYSDHDIWQALEKTGLKDKISSLEKQLYAPVVENGENFSVGERQLLCLTRALLRNSKIILLDEATASVDANTDAVVQQILQEAFSHCTIMTIAHRIHTVLNYDRILILSNGEVLEYDSPTTLRSNPNSVLSMLLKESKDKDEQ